MNQQERIQAFVEEIWLWYAKNKRTLPWRDLRITDSTERAYQILVSELMLQQTQVPRVKIIFRQFLKEFPGIKNLAAASNKDVILAWRGMGYNMRALRLRDCAKTICRDYNGIFPTGMQELQSLKGIGHYTAAAIRNFAFYLPTPCLDTNIRRILHRTFVGPESPDGTWEKDDAYLLQIAEHVLTEACRHPTYTTADWHGALMDFGSLVCTKKNPQWERCPLTRRGICKASYKVPTALQRKKNSSEPGRSVGSVFIPNRIFRGRIVEELRNASLGLKPEEVGQRICEDWSPRQHKRWLLELLQKLCEDQLLQKKGQRYILAS